MSCAIYSLYSNCNTEIIVGYDPKNLVTHDGCMSIACVHWLKRLALCLIAIYTPIGRDSSFLDYDSLLVKVVHIDRGEFCSTFLVFGKEMNDNLTSLIFLM